MEPGGVYAYDFTVVDNLKSNIYSWTVNNTIKKMHICLKTLIDII